MNVVYQFVFIISNIFLFGCSNKKLMHIFMNLHVHKYTAWQHKIIHNKHETIASGSI